MTNGAMDMARVAVIGLGGAADRIQLPAMSRMKDVRVIAGCDLDPETRRSMALRWRIPKTYESPEEMIDRETPDVVVIGTPPLTHPDMCVMALDKGCHVFCEKPFVPTVEDADRVIAAAERNGRTVAVNNQYYRMPIYKAVDGLLKRGDVGRLYHVNVWQQLYQLPADEGGWKAALQPHRVLYEFGTHTLDLLSQFFKAYPESVTARIPKVRTGVDADVFVQLRLDFPQDRVANITLNRVSHAPRKYIEMRLDCEEASLRASLGGVAKAEVGWNSEAGRPRFRFSLARGGELRLERDGKSKQLITQTRDSFYKACGEHFAQFLAAARSGGEPMVSATHAREVLRAIVAGYESADRGGELVRLNAPVTVH